MPFKIAVIGTHFTGKSTLCKHLSDHLEKKGFRVGMIGEVVRSCPFPVNEMATIKAQDWILEEQKRKEKELENHDVILMDRGVIDNYVYWKRVAERVNLDEETIKQREKEVFEHSKSYDVLFFVQPFDSTKIKDDKFRSVDPNWRKEMHEKVEEVVNRFQPYHKGKIFILNGNEKEVFESAKRHLEQLTKRQI